MARLIGPKMTSATVKVVEMVIESWESPPRGTGTGRSSPTMTASTMIETITPLDG